MERKKSGIFLISDPLRKGACFEAQPPAITAARRALRARDKNPAPSQIFCAAQFTFCRSALRSYLYVASARFAQPLTISAVQSPQPISGRQSLRGYHPGERCAGIAAGVENSDISRSRRVA
jgi:hypothetical protein